MTIVAVHSPDEVLLGFARALRAAGVAVTADRERTYLGAVAAVGLDDPSATYWAGRAALCAQLRPRAPRRPAHRHSPSRSGAVDARRTLRDQLRRMGEPGPIAWRRRGTRPRRVVLLV